MKKRKERRKKVERELLLSALALTCVVGGGDVSAQNSVDYNTALSALEIEAGAIAERKEILNQVDGLVIKVSEAFAESDLESGYVAIDEIDMLMSELKGQYGDLKREAVAKRIDKERLAFAKALIKGIKSDVRDKKYDAAQDKVNVSKKVMTSVDKLGMVEKLDSDLYDEVVGFDNLIRERKDNLKLKAETELSHEDVAPELEQETADIKLLLAQANTLYKAKKFMLARDVIESILIKDVYNVAAISMLDKIYKEMRELGEARRNNEILHGIHEVQWSWNESVVPKRDTINIAPPKPVSTSNAVISQKLRDIFIDSIEFDGADVSTAVKYLTERSKELDESGRGVAISASDALRRKVAGQTVTMSFDNIPLGEALKYLGQKLGTSYTITELGVIIGPVAQDMETRAIKVRPQMIAYITAGEDEDMGDEGDTDDFSIDDEFTEDDSSASGTQPSVNSGTLIAFFSERGIKFPEGARLRYNTNSNKLFVTNTIDNITRLEELVRQLDIDIPLVLVEAKILEITEDDLDDLGFNWSVDDGGTNDDGYPNSRVSGQTDFYRDGGATLARYGVIQGLKLFPGATDNSSPLVDVVAIQQQQRGELLSAPKVVATSGESSTVKMVEEHMYPESWNPPTVSTNAQVGSSITAPVPMFGDTKSVGIQLEVTPTVTSNYTISMSINPKITKQSTWSEYEYIIARDKEGTAADGTSPVGSSSVTPKTVRMPIISNREVVANVKVYDGETIVLGGLLTEESTYIDEKNPVFGDLPLIGTFFNRKMEDKVKMNILIFVTARLISGDGTPVRKNTDRGVPDFNR